MATLYGTSPTDPWRMEVGDDDEALRIAAAAATDDGAPVALLDEEGWWLVSPQGGEPEFLYGERDERRLLALGIEMGEEERAALYPQPKPDPEDDLDGYGLYDEAGDFVRPASVAEARESLSAGAEGWIVIEDDAGEPQRVYAE